MLKSLLYITENHERPYPEPSNYIPESNNCLAEPHYCLPGLKEPFPELVKSFDKRQDSEIEACKNAVAAAHTPAPSVAAAHSESTFQASIVFPVLNTWCIQTLAKLNCKNRSIEREGSSGH